MKRIFTFFLGILLVSSVFAQKPEGEIMLTATPPEIDGVLDEGIWDVANVYDIDKPFGDNVPTVGAAGETTWRAMWDYDYFYLFIEVADDNWYPSYASGANPWEADKPEIYFDVNPILEDGVGASGGAGHYQITPTPVEALIDGTASTEDNGVMWAFLVDPSGSYTAEYAIPWSLLLDSGGGEADKSGNIGFDITIIDSDEAEPARRRMVWANDDGAAESWNNMDGVGIITFPEAGEAIFIDEINLTGGEITTDNGTLQIEAEILPEDATNKTLKWSVSNSSLATISPTGVVTAKMDGTVTVTAMSADEFVEATAEVVISNQVVTVSDINYVRNGYFDMYDEDLEPDIWSNGQVNAEGVLVAQPSGEPQDIWNYQINQSIVPKVSVEDNDEPFLFSFVAWADVADTFRVNFEDSSRDYLRYGTSDHEYSTNGIEWTFITNTEPTRYEFDIIFSGIEAPENNQLLVFQLGHATANVYIDSVELVKVADLDLLSVVGIADSREASFRVYPNPAVNKLTIDLDTYNTKVAIYNSVGVKMEETIVTGNRHVFDVSRYRKGLYFVRANNSVVKFIK